MVERQDCDAYARTRLVKMTRFFLKYDKEGEPCVATTRHRAYASFSYEVAHQRVDRVQKPRGILDVGPSMHKFSLHSFHPFVIKMWQISAKYHMPCLDVMPCFSHV